MITCHGVVEGRQHLLCTGLPGTPRECVSGTHDAKVALDYTPGLLLPGWHCPCGCFNGAAKEWLTHCRACGAERDRREPCADDAAEVTRDATGAKPKGRDT